MARQPSKWSARHPFDALRALNRWRACLSGITTPWHGRDTSQPSVRYHSFVAAPPRLTVRSIRPPDRLVAAVVEPRYPELCGGSHRRVRRPSNVGGGTDPAFLSASITHERSLIATDSHTEAGSGCARLRLAADRRENGVAIAVLSDGICRGAQRRVGWISGSDDEGMISHVSLGCRCVRARRMAAAARPVAALSRCQLCRLTWSRPLKN